MTVNMLGIDASFSRITKENFAVLYGMGYRVFVQNLWTGGFENNSQLRTVAKSNLKDAADADVGMIVAAYVNANPWYPAFTSLSEAMNNAGDMWGKLNFVAIDVEIPETTEQQISDLLQAVKDRGIKTCIYTAHWAWTSQQNNTLNFSNEPLWFAYYNEVADLVNPLPFGGWTQDTIVGKQFGGSSELISGIQVDLNVFKDEWLGVEPVPVDDILVRLQAIETVLKKTNIEMASSLDIDMLETIRENQEAIKEILKSMSSLPPELLEKWL